MNREDGESERSRVGGVVVRELSAKPSNWRATGTLGEWLASARVPLVAEVDTRQLTPHIRSKGAMRGAVALGDRPTDDLRAALPASPSMDGLELAPPATVATGSHEGPAHARHLIH